ncbi:hypothetical protein ABZ379_00485 [Streptomyces canus]|uniref:hypothetical protein n=1 Tax=Streptomyces canus TaxID=58343 RepID=UPI0033D27355
MLQRLLRAALPSERLIVGAEVTSVDQSVPSRVRIPFGHGALEADLVVAADRVGSRLRSELLPDHAGPVYNGSTVLHGIGHIAFTDGRADGMRCRGRLR